MKRHVRVGSFSSLLITLLLSSAAFSDPVVTITLLHSGREAGLEFLQRDLLDLRLMQEDNRDMRHALLTQLQDDVGSASATGRLTQPSCPPPAVYTREQLPSVKLTLQPSRPQLAVGAPWSITGLLENQSEAPVYVVNRFTALTLPVEILDADVVTLPATFPTTNGGGDRAAEGYDVVGVFPKQTYQMVWNVKPVTWVHRLVDELEQDRPDWPRFLPGLWLGIRHLLYFHPHKYQVAATVHYWKDNPQTYLDCMQQAGLQASVSSAPSIITTAEIDIEASTWVIVLGALLGGMIAYIFLAVMKKRQWGFSGILGAFLLGPIVVLFLKRLGDAAFAVSINVNDFWGAIVIGYIAQYTGLQIIDRYVTPESARQVPPARRSPPEEQSGSTVEEPVRRP